MSLTEAQVFLSAFAAAVTPAPAQVQKPPPQRHARKLTPVQLSQDLPTTAFAKSASKQRPKVPNSPFRQPVTELAAKDTLTDPFLRNVPRKLETGNASRDPKSSVQTSVRPKRRSRRFVPLEQFQASGVQHDLQTISAKRGLNPLPCEFVTETVSHNETTPVHQESDIPKRIAKHVSHLRTISNHPNHFFPAVKILLSCFHSSTKGKRVQLWPNCQPQQATKYCREVLQQTLPLFKHYPTPVINALNQIITSTSQPEPPFPAVTGIWLPHLAGSTTSLRALEAEPESVTRRLLGNLETTWDQILRLQRMYRGDISSHPPGILDVNVALHAMAMLHPANMDVFATRLLKLVADTGLHARDTPVRMRHLGDRLRDAKPRKYGEKGPGVVLHRLPELVRSMFEDDPEQLFFLDFLTGVDSAKLNTALIPRLVAAVARGLEAAATATSNVLFTDAVLHARIYAKLLSVTMHSSNWAHSAFSLSGMKDNQVSPGLGVQSLQRRVPIHSAFFAAAIDVQALIRDAVTSEHVLPMLASVAVADVIIRLAAVDPVAKASEWYNRGIHAIRSVRVASACGESMPLLHTIVCSLLDSEACREEGPFDIPDADFVLRCDKEEWPAVGDTRLLRILCPLLDDLRKSVHMTDTGSKTTARRITPQAAPNVPSTLLKKDTETVKTADRTNNAEGDVQAALRREFHARMDGRLRELVRVVVSSRPVNGSVAKENYHKIVEMLYPDTTKTVVAVAANLCEYEVGLVERELRKNEKESDGGVVKSEQRRDVDVAGKGIREMKM